MNLRLFNSCQNRESLLGSPGILGRAGLLQDTVYGDMSQILQHIILLKPFPDPFMLCLVFCFHITDDLLEFWFIPYAVE
jgi:hypothetical protein